MRDHELDLIAALVEGRLDDETEARALVESSAEHRTEYEAQKLAFEAMSSVGTARLSDTERSALHRDVWTELRAAPARGTSSTSVPWYYRWVPIAAGMFVVVGLVAVLNQGGSPEAGEAAAQIADVSTTSAATAEGSDGGSTASDGDDAEDATDTTATSENSGVGAVDLARALTPSGEQYYAAAAEKVREGLEEDVTVESFNDASSEQQLQECVDESGLDEYDVLGVNPSPIVAGEGPAPVDVTPFIVAAPDDADPATAAIAFVDLFSCDVIYVDD